MITASKILSKKKPKVRNSWSKQKVVFTCTLRDLRKGLGLTLREVAGCGVDIATINRAEYGHEIHLSHALALAAFYEKPIEEIWSSGAARRQQKESAGAKS